MNIPTKHPQEIEFWYVLPAIRKELVLTLRERGLSQKEIAHVLNVTEPAVSQYIKSKRANAALPENVKYFIGEAATKITDNQTAYQQIQRISNFIKETRAICQIHMDVEDGLEGCDICYR